jgi:hypothetical protein
VCSPVVKMCITYICVCVCVCVCDGGGGGGGDSGIMFYTNVVLHHR